MPIEILDWMNWTMALIRKSIAFSFNFIREARKKLEVRMYRTIKMVFSLRIQQTLVSEMCSLLCNSILISRTHLSCVAFRSALWYIILSLIGNMDYYYKLKMLTIDKFTLPIENIINWDSKCFFGEGGGWVLVVPSSIDRPLPTNDVPPQIEL